MLHKVKRLILNLSENFVYFTKISAAIWSTNKNISVSIVLIWTSLSCFITLSLAKRTVKNFTIIFFSLVSCFNGGSSGSVDNSMTKWQSNKTLILPIKKLTTSVAINPYSLGQNYPSNWLWTLVFTLKDLNVLELVYFPHNFLTDF